MQSTSPTIWVELQTVRGQVCRDGSSFDCSIADDSDRASYIDDGGRSPAGGRSGINDQIDRVAKAVLDFLGRAGRWHAFTIRTRAGHRPDPPQQINQRLPGTETDADRAGSRRHRIGESQPLRERRL